MLIMPDDTRNGNDVPVQSTEDHYRSGPKSSVPHTVTTRLAGNGNVTAVLTEDKVRGETVAYKATISAPFQQHMAEVTLELDPGIFDDYIIYPSSNGVRLKGSQAIDSKALTSSTKEALSRIFSDGILGAKESTELASLVGTISTATSDTSLNANEKKNLTAQADRIAAQQDVTSRFNGNNHDAVRVVKASNANGESATAANANAAVTLHSKEGDHGEISPDSYELRLSDYHTSVKIKKDDGWFIDDYDITLGIEATTYSSRKIVDAVRGATDRVFADKVMSAEESTQLADLAATIVQKLRANPDVLKADEDSIVAEAANIAPASTKNKNGYSR